MPDPSNTSANELTGLEIAVVGLACRFPGARDAEQFWHNVASGVESIRFFSDEELAAAGVPPEVRRNPGFVAAGAVVDDIDRFDAGFFGLSPREAEIVDPQQRIFLECAVEALEDAGCDPDRFAGGIGVWAGVGVNSYLLFNILGNPELVRLVGRQQLDYANRGDTLTTRTAYKLNLRGPAVTVQTTCSTSLVAIHLAAQSLLAGECEMALAGGVTIDVGQRQGYVYREGGILSPDGHCRAFDADAAGMISGNGCGIVVLRRLADALEAGDRILAVIRGSAINNDGSLKASYTAPSVEGQARVVRAAQIVADVEPESLSYIEAHGTGTHLGDPVEVAALTRAFRAATDHCGFCALGSVKTNIGHLDVAAGVAGFIKTVLSLHHRQIPPSLHFTNPHPAIDFAASPFYVNTALSDWPATRGAPRRAGVSSLGIGGTNAHVILEEAPPSAISAPSRQRLPILVSAKTPAALDAATVRLAAHFRLHPDLSLGDAAYTLAVGRRAYEHRRVVVASNLDDAVSALEDLGRLSSGAHDGAERSVVFLFPGQGSQYSGMASELYRSEPVYRAEVDRCAELLRPHLVRDLRELLMPAAGHEDAAAAELRQTRFAQPALFTVEYALAKLWIEWGVRPRAMLGHSLGEYVAACLAGVFSLEDGLSLVAARGRMMQAVPPGAMLSVPLAEQEVLPLLGNELSVAAINGPSSTVVSGPEAAVADLAARLAGNGIEGKRLHTSHAFHSAMMEPIVEPFAERVSRVRLSPPEIPFLSNLTGTWITAAQATDPQYWARHLRSAVRFADAVRELLAEPGRIFLEVGPGRALSGFTRLHKGGEGGLPPAVASLRHALDEGSDLEVLLTALGHLWLAGAKVDWSSFWSRETRRKVALPTYPFERERYWIEPSQRNGEAFRPALERRAGPAEWLYVPVWRQTPPRRRTGGDDSRAWLVFAAEPFGHRVAERLRAGGRRVMIAEPGSSFRRLGEDRWALAPDAPEGYRLLLDDLAAAGTFPAGAAHLWSLAANGIEAVVGMGEESLAALTTALEGRTETFALTVAARSAAEVSGDEALLPLQAAILGVAELLPHRLPGFACAAIDLPVDDQDDRLADRLVAEILAVPTLGSTTVVALRGRSRWELAAERLAAIADSGKPAVHPGAVVLLGGGLGRVGHAIARYLAFSCSARLVFLTDRGAHPSPDLEVLQELAPPGAEVAMAEADLADPADVREVLLRVRERFGALDAVIYGHGLGAILPEGGSGRRLYEAAALVDALQGERLAFGLLLAPIHGVVEGTTETSAAAWAAFAGVAACLLDRGGAAPWRAVQWDTWRFPEDGSGEARFAVTPEEGIELFRRILDTESGPVLVASTADLAARRRAAALRTEERAPASELPVQLHSRPRVSTSFVAPRTPRELLMAGLWEQLLGISGLGVHDDFFELGGHSLLATQLLSRIRDTFRVELPLKVLFEAPNVSGLTAAVELAEVVGGDLAAPPLVPVRRDGQLQLSFAQRRLWFLHSFEPGSDAYNMPLAVRLSGGLRADALERTLTEIVRRHEVLRTVFSEVDGDPVQVILPAGPIEVRRIDLGGLPLAEREEKMREIASVEARQPFDLARGPLVRAALVRLDEREHVALLTMHHIVTDGWSMGIFVGELCTLYRAFALGEPSPLPDLPIQYADFAQWQRAYLDGPVLSHKLDYWRQAIGVNPPVLELPTDRPRSRERAWGGAALRFSVPVDLAAALYRFSQQRNATLFMTLLTAFEILLYRYSGQDSLLVGTPIANRNRSEIENLIGFFVNTLVLRTDLGGEPTVEDLLGRVRAASLAAHDRQDVPFERLVEELQSERDLSRSPLFQAFFVLQNTPASAADLPDLRLSLLLEETRSAKFDLSLQLEEGSNGLSGLFEYSTDLFDRPTVDRMVEHFLRLLGGMVDTPARAIAHLALLGAVERQQVTVEWNDTAVDFGGEACLHALVEAQVARTPEAVALELRTEQLTYRELDRRAGRLARHLRALGVGPEVLVGVAVQRSFELIVGLLAVLKAGGAYVPLDPGYPEERLAFMIQDSGVPVLLTQEPLAERLGSLSPKGVHQVFLDSYLPADDDAEPLVTGVGPDHAAYAIYTSGSTGRPKGVVNTHRGIVNHMLWMQQVYALTASDRVLQKTPYSFDASIWEIFSPLLAGARLVLAEPGGHQDSRYLVDAVERYSITTLQLVPSMCSVFLEEEGVTEACRSLRRLFCGGEALSAELVERCHERLGADLCNLYGPTEAAIEVTSWVCDRQVGHQAAPIGRPISNLRIYLLDRGELVPIGLAGELHIGGAGLARGYLNRPELTAERFVPDSLSAMPGARLYRTGDLARLRPHGEIEYLGRLDHQVKVRGFRIELGEIEAAIALHPGVREAVVLAHGDRLVAYLVPVDGEVAATELRDVLQRSLPEHMVPQVFVSLSAMPMTPNGKLDRRALPAPDGPRLEREHVAPRNETEVRLAAIFAEVLGVERIGIFDSFFEIGGHSLKAMQVVSRVRRAFGVELPLRRLFQAPTVAGLAVGIGESQASAREKERIDAALSRLSGLSEDEARALLAKKLLAKAQAGKGGVR